MRLEFANLSGYRGHFEAIRYPVQAKLVVMTTPLLAMLYNFMDRSKVKNNLLFTLLAVKSGYCQQTYPTPQL